MKAIYIVYETVVTFLERSVNYFYLGVMGESKAIL